MGISNIEYIKTRSSLFSHGLTTDDLKDFPIFFGKFLRWFITFTNGHSSISAKIRKNERPKIDFDIVIPFAIKNYIEVNISYPSNHYSKSSPPNLTGIWRKLGGSFLIPMQKSDPL